MESQCKQILDYITEHGSITSAEAFYQLGCSRLSGRIYDLKKRGYDINATQEVVRTRNGRTTNITRYSLA